MGCRAHSLHLSPSPHFFHTHSTDGKSFLYLLENASVGLMKCYNINLQQRHSLLHYSLISPQTDTPSTSIEDFCFYLTLKCTECCSVYMLYVLWFECISFNTGLHFQNTIQQRIEQNLQKTFPLNKTFPKTVQV